MPSARPCCRPFPAGECLSSRVARRWCTSDSRARASVEDLRPRHRCRRRRHRLRRSCPPRIGGRATRQRPELVCNEVNLLRYFTRVDYFTLCNCNRVQSHKSTFTCNEVHLSCTLENVTNYQYCVICFF